MSEKVTEQTVLGDILNQPNGKEILSNYKLPCLSCPMAALEMGVLKIGDICRMYGIDQESLIKDLNENLEEKPREESAEESREDSGE